MLGVGPVKFFMVFRKNVESRLGVVIASQLIFDFGIGNGVDSVYYLKRGFQVVAVDASIEACSHLENLLRGKDYEGSITIINKAISPIGTDHCIFYFNQRFDHLSSIDENWALRDGGSVSSRVVESVSLGLLFQEFGLPSFIKCDIEGAEIHFLDSLKTVNELPTYLSLEDCRFGMDYVRTLADMGYQEFQLVDQSLIPGSLDDFGNYFLDGSSGRPGFELPRSRWLSLETFSDHYFSTVRTSGGDRLATRSHWFDIHARLTK